jgi:hypothetical protein
MMVMAISDPNFQTWLKNLSAMRRGWPIATLVIGLVLAAAGAMRLT